MTATFRCGHPKTEVNSYEWLDRERGKMRRKCRTCQRKRRREWAKTEEFRASERRRWAKPRRPIVLTADDPRHGTVHGYNEGGCRDRCCRDAMNRYQRIRRLKRKAEALGIPIPRDLQQVRSVVSLDAVAERWFGMDRVNPGTEWDDPTAEEALG